MKCYILLSMLIWLIIPLQAQDNPRLVVVDSLEIEVSETEFLRSVRWSPDGNYLAVGSVNGIWLFNHELELINHFNNIFTDVVSIDWSPDSSRIVFHTYSLIHERSVMAIANIRTGNNFVIRASGSGIIAPIRWSPDGALIAMGNAGRETLVLDAVTGDLIFFFPAPEGGVDELNNFAYGYCWLDDGQTLLADYHLNTFVFDMTSQELITQYRKISFGSADCSPSSDILLIATNSWINWVTGEMGRFDIPSAVALSWHPSGAYFAFNVPNRVLIWTSDGEDLLLELEGGILELGGPIHYDDSIHWHPDGELLAAVGEDNILRVWRISDGE